MSYQDLLDGVKTLYPVNKVSRGFKYWTYTLTEKCLGMFEYTGLPDTLPVDELEIRLIQSGYAGVFKHKEKGIVTAYGAMSGIDMYYKPTTFVYAQPVLGSGKLEIHKDVVIIYNSEIDTIQPLGLWELIRRYARILADIDSSINILTVNTRATKLNVAKNQNVATSVNAVMKKIQLGEYDTINDFGILDCFKTISFNEDKNETIQDLLLARDSMLRSFYQEIGVKSALQKKERLITDEVSSDNQLLLINQADMLAHRKKGVEEINRMFGTKISVEISKEYKPIMAESEDIINDNN